MSKYVTVSWALEVKCEESIYVTDKDHKIYIFIISSFPLKRALIMH